ncbi:MAG: glycosyltransferase family 2 protein [Candidatus Omnitrophota bacterium]
MLSIVILTCNSQKYIQACLNSILSQGAKGIEIVVIDNASSDKTPGIIKTHYPWLKLIENPQNFGASKARNQGIECSSGEWLLTLDSDVVLENGFIEKFENVRGVLGSDVGMIQPNVLMGDGKTIYSQGIHLTVFRRFHDLNQGKSKDFTDESSKQIIGPCSAAAFYKRNMLNKLKEKTGYFDERFFFLVEDVDLAWRAKRAGWKVLFDSQLECRHVGNSSNTDEKFRQYLCFRNRHWMITKNEDFWGKVKLYALSMPYELARGIFLAIFNKYFWTKS